jgi:hypothetical protein
MDGADQGGADTVHPEQVFGDDRAAEDRGDAEGDDGHHRDQRIAQHMLQDHGLFGHAFGSGGADIIGPHVFQHGRAHVAADHGGVGQAQGHHRHGHLAQLHHETVPVRHLQGGVVFGGEPTEPDRENDDDQRAGKEGRDGKADHGEHRAELVEPGILPVGRIDADGQGDQHADQIGRADHGQGLRNALADDGEDRGARLPGQDALFAAGEAGAEDAVEQGGRLDPEELAEPEEIAHEDRLIGAHGRHHLLAHLGRDGQRNLGHRRAGGEIDQQKDHDTDDQKRRDRHQKPAEGEDEHARRRLGSEVGAEIEEGGADPAAPPGDQFTSRGTSPRRSTSRCPRR